MRWNHISRVRRGSRLQMNQMWSGLCAVVGFVALLGASQAYAMAVLDVDGTTGQLLGASGVEVGGNLYDVEFLDGTCIDLYTSCDNAADDFTFTTTAAAQMASQALLDQVFIDGPMGAFDTDPGLTRGCVSASQTCTVFTPYGVDIGAGGVQVYAAQNSFSEGGDRINDSLSTQTVDFFGLTNATSGRWNAQVAAPVPEPSAALLFAVGVSLTSLRMRPRTKR